MTTQTIGTLHFDSELAGLLRSRGQRVTPQRLLIHQALCQMDRHASAEEVLEAVSKRLPNASLPTVYATLDLLQQLGVIRRLTAGGGATLYDPRTDDHHHFVCTICGRVEDLEADLRVAPVLTAARRRGFKPDRADVVLTGRCADCARAE